MKVCFRKIKSLLENFNNLQRFYIPQNTHDQSWVFPAAIPCQCNIQFLAQAALTSTSPKSAFLKGDMGPGRNQRDGAWWMRDCDVQLCMLSPGKKKKEVLVCQERPDEQEEGKEFHDFIRQWACMGQGVGWELDLSFCFVLGHALHCSGLIPGWAQGTILWCWGSNLDWLCARQAAYLPYDSSGSENWIVLKEMTLTGINYEGKLCHSLGIEGSKN